MFQDSTIAADSPAHTGTPIPQASISGTEKPHRFVTFFLGETQFAISADAVEGVTTPLTPTPLPDGPAALSGLAHLRGEIVAMVELGHDLAGKGEKRRSVILRSFDRSQEMPIGFNVDRAGEILQINVADIGHSEFDDSFAPFEAVTDDRQVRIVEPSRIAALLA